MTGGDTTVKLAVLALSVLLTCAAARAADAPDGRPRAPAKPPTDQQITDELRAYVTRRVNEGFRSRDEIITDALEYIEGEHKPADLKERVTKLTDEAIADHRRRQATWKGLTDCDRLDRAFRELEEAGVVARQNFADCQTCGHAEIGAEIQEAAKRRHVIGYTFYHWQDTESAAETGTLYLAYGSTDGDDRKTLKAAERVVQALERAGLKVEWNGKIDERIRVVDLNWKRRRND